METTQLTVTIKFKWWLNFYLYGVSAIASLTDSYPNEDKLNYWINKAMVVGIE